MPLDRIWGREGSIKTRPSVYDEKHPLNQPVLSLRECLLSDCCVPVLVNTCLQEQAVWRGAGQEQLPSRGYNPEEWEGRAERGYMERR